MAGFQWVVLLSMVAIASSCHVPVKSCSCKKGGNGGGIIVPVKVGLAPIVVAIGKTPLVKVPIVIKGGGHGFINLGIFVRGLSGIVRTAIDIINDVIGWKINTIFDVLHIIISLGTLFGNLVIAIYKILICVVGLPRIGGNIGSRDICRDDYGCKYGWKRYTGKYSNHIDILKHYGVYDARAQCESILRQWTNGGGVDKLDYSSRIVYERVLRLTDLVARDYKSWCQDDFSEVYFSVTLILGVFANRCRSGLGLKFADEIQEIFIDQFRSQNIDITSNTISIKKSLESIEESQWSGVFIYSSESSQQDTSVRQIETDKENRETNTRRDDKNEQDSTNKQETNESSKSGEQASGQKCEKTDKDSSSEKDDNKSDSESNGSKSGRISSEKYSSKVDSEDSAAKKASAENKSSSNFNTNTETSEGNGESRSKSSVSAQTSQESKSAVSEEEKHKVSKEVNVEKVDQIY